MSHRNKNVVRFEKKATNHVGLFFVFIFAVAIFGGGGFLLYKYRDQIDWNFTLPWESGKDGENGKDSSGKKSKKELVVPEFQRTKSIIKGKSTFEIIKIETDEKGFVIHANFKTTSPQATFDVNQVVIDGYHTTTTFKVKDTFSGNDPAAREGTNVKFRIYQTDLDKYNLTSFKNLVFHYTLYENDQTYNNCITQISFTNYVKTSEGLKGLAEVGDNERVFIKYYKTDKFLNETYIYFFVDNKNTKFNTELKIKKLMINDRLYDMPEFIEVLPKGSGTIFAIRIPEKKIKEVENFTVSFFILEYNTTGTSYNSIYSTNDYTKEL